jgi:hypothetical protein
MSAEYVTRHEVGSELDTFEVEAEDLTERFHERGLADSRESLEQDVTAAEDRGHHHSMEFGAAEQNAVELLDRAPSDVDRRLKLFGCEY